MRRFFSILGDRFFRSLDEDCSLFLLGLFRICYSIVLFCEVLQLSYFRHLIFDVVPFVEPGQLNYMPVLMLWLLIILCLILGLFTRFIVIANYALTVAFFSAFSSFEYHVDYVFIGVNFLLIFAPISHRLSLDRFFCLLNGRGHIIQQDGTSANAYRLLFIFSGISLIYADSIYHKLNSALWTDGLGVWLPASVPFATWTGVISVLNSKALMLFLGYLTLVFEAVFIFAMWFRRPRPYLFVIGLGLHVGILVTFPIPWFALTSCSLYILLIPDSWIQWAGVKFRRSTPLNRIAFNPDESIQQFMKVVVSHFDVRQTCAFEEDPTLSTWSCQLKDTQYRGKDAYRACCRSIAILWPLSWFVDARLCKFAVRSAAGAFQPRHLRHSEDEAQTDDARRLKFRHSFVAFLLILMAFSQLSSTVKVFSQSRKTRRLAKEWHLSSVRWRVAMIATKISKATSTYLGTHPHGVFVNGHFDGYDKIVAIQYQGDESVWLPIIRPTGKPGYYSTGRIWVNWTFRVNGPHPKYDKLRHGIQRYTAFWAVTNNKSLNDSRFEILVKTIDTPSEWEPDFLKIQIAKEWQSIGFAHWKDKQFSWDESIWDAFEEAPLPKPFQPLTPHTHLR